MKISYEGVGQLAVTFPAGNCAAGHVCSIDDLGRATACEDGDAFIGVVQAVEGDKAAVIVDGFITVNYSGTVPGYGSYLLTADGQGGVQCDNTGDSYLIVAVDKTAQTCVIKL